MWSADTIGKYLRLFQHQLFFPSLSGPVLMYNFELPCSNQLVRFNLNALHNDLVCRAGTKMGGICSFHHQVLRSKEELHYTP